MKKSTAKTCSHAAPPRCAGRVTPEADLTWLLHRAAHRMRAAMEEQVEKHDIQLRDYLVLTALGGEAQTTQLALGQAMGLDKTTMTSLLDRLEQEGLVVRCSVPHDRRARIPQATDAGRALQAKVANALARVESELLAAFSAAEQHSLRSMLCHIIRTGEGSDTHISGSCV
ncbi:MAG: MarR family transcriptional regulator [Burkholderiales bacterium]|nr:MarR family transcriptional regulator [Burkholderiales bacterium]